MWVTVNANEYTIQENTVAVTEIRRADDVQLLHTQAMRGVTDKCVIQV